MSKKSNDEVKVRITRLGGGNVSTGAHVAVSGEVMAQAGDTLSLPRNLAEALEAQGYGEIQ